MAAHDIALMGAVYPAVPQVTLPIDGGGSATFTDVSDTTALAPMVDSAAYFYTSAGAKTQGTGRINLWENGDVTITSSYGVSDNDLVRPIPAGVYSLLLTNQTTWTGGTVYISFHSVTASAGSLSPSNRIGAHSFAANATDRQVITLTAEAKGVRLEAANTVANSSGQTATYTNMFLVPEPLSALQSVTGVNPTESSQTIRAAIGYAGLADVQINAIPSDFVGSAVKNIQAYMGTDSVAVTSYTATDVTLTVKKAGSYKVSWMGWRNTTSGTSGSQLFINGTGYGTANTTFGAEGSTYVQSNALTGVSLAKDDVIVVRARARSTSYFMAVGNLIIEEE